MQFILILTVFIYGSENKPFKHQYDMPSFEECMKSEESIYLDFTNDPTVHELAVQCVAHRDADQPVEQRDG